MLVKSFHLPLDEEAKKAPEAVTHSLNLQDVNEEGFSHQLFTIAIDAESNHTLSIEGEGIIREIQIHMSEENLQYARDLALTVSYGTDTASVIHVKLLDFFHIGYQLTKYQSRYASFQDNRLSFRMPLPFDQELTIDLTNPTQHSFQNIKLDSEIERINAGSMRLHAITREYQNTYGDTLQILDTAGKGVNGELPLHYVATLFYYLVKSS